MRLQAALQKPRSGAAGGSAYIMESVYSTLFLGLLKLRNFQDWSRMKQAVDVHEDMYIPSSASARVLADDTLTHILREASASLLVLLIRAMRRPQQAGRATSTALTLFFINQSNANAVSPAVKYYERQVCQANGFTV